jgi:hypothetical protein
LVTHSNESSSPEVEEAAERCGFGLFIKYKTNTQCHIQDVKCRNFVQSLTETTTDDEFCDRIAAVREWSYAKVVMQSHIHSLCVF